MSARERRACGRRGIDGTPPRDPPSLASYSSSFLFPSPLTRFSFSRMALWRRTSTDATPPSLASRAGCAGGCFGHLARISTPKEYFNAMLAWCDTLGEKLFSPQARASSNLRTRGGVDSTQTVQCVPGGVIPKASPARLTPPHPVATQIQAFPMVVVLIDGPLPRRREGYVSIPLCVARAAPHSGSPRPRTWVPRKRSLADPRPGYFPRSARFGTPAKKTFNPLPFRERSRRGGGAPVGLLPHTCHAVLNVRAESWHDGASAFAEAAVRAGSPKKDDAVQAAAVDFPADGRAAAGPRDAAPMDPLRGAPHGRRRRRLEGGASHARDHTLQRQRRSTQG